jgi:hypothetical protein
MSTFLWALCGVVPGICVWGGGLVTLYALERMDKLPNVVDLWIVSSALVALPFVTVAMLWSRLSSMEVVSERGRFVRAAWSGVGINACVWTWMYCSVYEQLVAGASGGADIILGIIVLANPVVVGATMWVVLRWGGGRNRRVRGR